MRRYLPAPRPSRLYARVSDALERDGRLSATAIKLGLWLVKWARGRRQVDGFIDQIADAIGRKRRMVQYAQAELERCGYIRIERVREGRINDANIYHLEAPLIAPPAPRRRLPMRSSMGVQNPAPHEGGLEPRPSSEPGTARARGSSVSGAPLVAAQVARPGASRSAFPAVPSPAAGKNCSPSGAARKIGAQTDAPSATGPP